MRPWELQAVNKAGRKEIRFAWVCRNIHFNEIERVELTDTMLLTGSYPSWITSDNCEILAKILPTGKPDKKGKEIWEGDIITGDAGMGFVEYEDCCFVLNREAYIKKHGNAKYIEWPEDYFDDCEIIGDIWRNPELLKENT